MIGASELFRGTAPYHARHAVPYPDELFRSLVRLCRIGNSSRVLDLGAGTGQISIPLARLVANVLFVEPSDEMVQEGRRIAEALGAKNIDFLVSRSEGLNEPGSSFDIAVIADSFFFMDGAMVLAKLAQMVKLNGCVAIINRVRDSSEPGEWNNPLLNEIKEFWGGSFPGPALTLSDAGVRPSVDREVLRASDFREITELRHYYERHWNIDDLLGYLYSTSLGASGNLGPRRDEFTTRVRRLLLSYSPSGSFTERGHITTLLGYRP
ncbi:class I SAM-dependent methyltransferase [Bradyrhizobium sp. SSUT112]|uniref:class I SAM-dependent methyltransferase n=1 Tax=Bradyrhizobium sp. SSUT112 TaxID=3040604 RepID=UPI002449A6CB|nr:class I SAM-dependent methyltransferase [Bradyrhizobium sp. SSUT112]MDH2356508.1 class I SAM-dependent methyltransferase [Bradyrhizobium sp. SSUT112]